ncbi:MAG: ABC transporter permease [Acidimicrobiia bacterium]|nr:ABC transporter permease [Acidimicrobiia bacterium]
MVDVGADETATTSSTLEDAETGDSQNADGAAVRRRFFDEQRVLVAGSVIGFLTLWEVASRQGWIRDLFFSSPSAVFMAAIREVQRASFWWDFRVSALEFTVGFSLAIILGIPIGLILGWFRKLEYFWDPWLSFMYATPRITYIPLLVTWFGLGLTSKMALVFAGPFFTIVIGTLEGVRTVPSKYLDVSRSFGANHWQFFKTILLPNTVPFILASMRLAVGIGIVAIVLGEMYASQAGIGNLLMTAANNLQADRVLFAVLIFTMMGVGLSKVLQTIEKRVAQWKPEQGR